MEHYGTYNTEEIHSFSQTPVFMKKKLSVWSQSQDNLGQSIFIFHVSQGSVCS